MLVALLVQPCNSYEGLKRLNLNVTNLKVQFYTSIHHDALVPSHLFGTSISFQQDGLEGPWGAWMSCSENIRALATIRRWFGQRCLWKNAAWSHALCQYRWEHFKCWEDPYTPMKTTPTRKKGLIWPYWWGGSWEGDDSWLQLPASLTLTKVNAACFAFREPLWWAKHTSPKNAGCWLPLASDKPGVLYA